MMKKTINTLLLLGILLCTGCGSKNIIDEERTFAGDVWNRFTPEVFEVNVANTDDYYNISTPQCPSRRMAAGKARSSARGGR